MSHPATDAAPFPPLAGSRWQVQMLGGLRLRCGDIRIARFPDRPTLLLFARLALQPRVLQGRDALAEALWPELLDEDGRRERADAAAVRRRRLRKTLSRLCTALRAGGPPHVEPIWAERETLGLNAAAFDIDVHRFDRHCARREHEAARRCYGGDLLPGLGDDWIERERARLAAARARLDATEPLADPDADLDPADPADAGPARRSAPQARPLPLAPPAPRQHFFGRETEIDSLRDALQTHRLVTLVGTGGCGKTALAAQLMQRPLGFKVVAMAGLEDCAAPAGIVDRIRVALDLQRDGGDMLAQIAAQLDGARTLLVLDNFEHLADDAGRAELDRLLQALPAVRLLLTTRRALPTGAPPAAPGNPPEAAFRIELSPLPLPGPGDELGVASRNPGVALFVAAAQAARADFSINHRNLAGVIAVCRRLDGLPLSIELAAAKIRDFAPRDMAFELERSARLLARVQVRGAQVRRHASLALALDWSWRLLDEPARRMLRSLAVFRGGWTLDQARALTAAPGADEAQADALLAGLMRDSLLQRLEPEDGPPRLGLLGALREVIVEQCDAALLMRLRQQHRALFLAHARRLAASDDWPAEADDANCVEALETACADADDASALGLATALAEPWRSRGASARALDALRALARRERLPAAARVDLLALQAILLINAGRGREAHAEVALALALAGADAALLAPALLAGAHVLWRSERSAEGMAQALGHVERAEALLAILTGGTGAPSSMPPSPALTRLRGRLLLTRGGLTLVHLGQVDAAAHLFEEAERVFSVLGDRRSAILALPGRTACLLRQNRFREAIAVARKGEREAAALRDPATRLQLFDRLSVAHEALGQFEEALQTCQRQTRLAHRHGLHYYASYGVWNQCHPLAQLGHHERAANLLAFACRHWYEGNGELDADDRAYVARVRRDVGATLGAARLRAAWERGRALSLHEALDMAAGRPDAPQPGSP